MSSSSRYRLTVRKGPLPGKVFDLAKSLLTIGREVKNDIVINDAEVSRQHLRLTEQAGSGYMVEDLASTNGTFVNGQRLSTLTALRSGDILGLGGTVELEYSAQREPERTVFAGQSNPPQPEPWSPPPASEPARVTAELASPPVSPSFSVPAASTPPRASAPASSGIQPWMWIAGIGCVVLSLCACVFVVGLALLPVFQQMIG
jgi:hypothetical protein